MKFLRHNEEPRSAEGRGIKPSPRIKYPAAEQRGISFSRGIGLGFNTLMAAPEGRGIKPSPRIKQSA
jgi:hypothetical protein